jgi:hypothetical protein
MHANPTEADERWPRMRAMSSGQTPIRDLPRTGRTAGRPAGVDTTRGRLVRELAHSNDQTEGQITKLKLLKRSMYGRASFELLRRRVLLAA